MTAFGLYEHHAIARQEPQHRIATYNRGCRCDQCKEASRLAKRRQRAKRRVS